LSSPVKTNERAGTRAVVRYVRVSATKARAVLNQIRDEPVGKAKEILTFAERSVSEVILNCLNSAASNALNNDGIPLEELYVSACFADEGPTLKRFRPRARGRASSILKRTCHITIIVTRYSPEQLEDFRIREDLRAEKALSNVEEKVDTKKSKDTSDEFSEEKMADGMIKDSDIDKNENVDDKNQEIAEEKIEENLEQDLIMDGNNEHAELENSEQEEKEAN
tara:strand:- start:1106 stop:1774 length:669 start_codon:yes stop_codon:yes gene_type:complete